MRDSTKALMAKHGWRLDRAIHNYLYFAFYYPYVKIAYLVFRFLANHFSWFKPFGALLKPAFNRYHAKILSFSDTQKILELNADLSAVSAKNKQIVPYKYAYKILLQEPDYIAVMDCPCKKTLNAPAWSINSCICVGKTTAQFWLDRCGKKYHARKISQNQALDLIKTFRAQGYLTQAFFKVATGGSLGVICNCHINSCVSLQATMFARRFDPSLSMSANSGYSIEHNTTLCRNCGTCAKICQFGAIRFRDNIWTYDSPICIGCELCAEHCPQQAITLVRDPNKTVPLDLDLIKAEYAE